MEDTWWNYFKKNFPNLLIPVIPVVIAILRNIHRKYLKENNEGISSSDEVNANKNITNDSNRVEAEETSKMDTSVDPISKMDIRNDNSSVEPISKMEILNDNSSVKAYDNAKATLGVVHARGSVNFRMHNCTTEVIAKGKGAEATGYNFKQA